MQEEKLFEYMKNDRKFTEVDPFKEFMSGLDNASVYILAAALEVYEDTGLEMWNAPIAPRTRAWKQIAIEELSSRHAKAEKVMHDLADELLTSLENCPHCYKGDVYGQFPEDGPLHECPHCWPKREAHAMYTEYLERRNKGFAQ